LLLSASFAGAQSQQFTLEQAVAHGLQHNKEVISSQLESKIATKKPVMLFLKPPFQDNLDSTTAMSQ
jgi:hypothetical protein